jgi:diguanylate cyclase (GGDEF)-like protein
MIFCDLDGFKPINERLGHQAGDYVLRAIGQRLQGAVRGTDVVGRLPGDLRGIAEPSVDDAVARIRAAFTAPIAVNGSTCTVGASVGVAIAPAGTDISADALIAEADQAMYELKRARPPAATGGISEPD